MRVGTGLGGLAVWVLIAAGAGWAQQCFVDTWSPFINPATNMPVSQLLEPKVYSVYSNGKLIATYIFFPLDKSLNKWGITANGAPYTDDPVNNPDGIYDFNMYLAIRNSICPPSSIISGSVPPPDSLAQMTSRGTAAGTALSGQAAGPSVEGDFDGDGIPDIAIANAGFVQVNLYNAQGTIASSQRIPTGAPYAGSIVAADFNGDGHLDLAVTELLNTPPGLVAVMLGKGDGTFGSPQTYAAGTAPVSIVTADFNGDGKADVAVTNGDGTNPGTVAVLLGKGDGTLAPIVTYAAGLIPVSVVAADWNGDGKLDLAVIDARAGGIYDQLLILPGKGDGTFAAPLPAVAVGTNLGSLTYTDLNHDGKLDLLIADRRGSDFTVLLGNGDGTFRAPVAYVSGANPASIAVVPTGDNYNVLFTGDAANGNVVMDVATPDGTLSAAPIQMVGRAPAAVAIADLNGDKKGDLVLTDSGGSQVWVLMNDGSGTLGKPVGYAVGSSPVSTAIADVTGDGKPDLVVADANGVEVLNGKGDGTFAAAQTSAVGVVASPAGIVMADFNGDGKIDAAVAGGNGSSILLGKGNGTFSAGATVTLAGTVFPIAVVTGDFNGDGKADLAIGYDLMATSTTETGNVAVLLGKGDGTFQAPVTVALAGTVRSLAAGDINKDGKLDLVAGVQTLTGDQVTVLPGKGDGSFGAPMTAKTVTSAPSMVVGDLDGDGNLDLLLGDCCGLSEATFMLGNGDGTFHAEQGFPSGPSPVAVALGSFTGGSKPDLAIAGTGNGHGTLVTLYNHFAAAAVSNAASGTAPIAPGSLATAYGTDLANGNYGGTGSPRPLMFGGTTVGIQDASGTTSAAPLVYVSPGQVNFLAPATVAVGTATVVVTSGDGTQSAGSVKVSAVAPGMFTLNGAGLAAAVGVLVGADGSQTPEPVYTVNAAGAVVASPISLGGASDQLVLLLFGTGFRAAGTGGVAVTVNGQSIPVQYAGAQGTFEGLDQINLTLPRSLVGAGKVNIVVSAGGITANAVNVTIQ